LALASLLSTLRSADKNSIKSNRDKTAVTFLKKIIGSSFQLLPAGLLCFIPGNSLVKESIALTCIPSNMDYHTVLPFSWAMEMWTFCFMKCSF